MGYQTYFSGTIVFGGLKKEDIKKLKNLIHNHAGGLAYAFEIQATDNGFAVTVSGEWKNYDEEMEKVLKGFVRAFPRAAEGWIDAQGDERDDNWALEIKKGILRKIVYELTEGSSEVLFNAKGETEND